MENAKNFKKENETAANTVTVMNENEPREITIGTCTKYETDNYCIYRYIGKERTIKVTLTHGNWSIENIGTNNIDIFLETTCDKSEVESAFKKAIKSLKQAIK